MANYQPILPPELANMGFKNNTLNAVYLGIACPWDGKTKKQHYSVKVPGIKGRFDFYCRSDDQKIGFDTSDALSFLGCLFGDSELGSDLFEDFCINLGYDSDSRKAFGIYSACQKTKIRLRELFSDSQQAEILEYLREEGY